MMLRRLLGPKKSLPTNPYEIVVSPEKPVVTLTQPEHPSPSFSPLRGEVQQRQPDGGKAAQKAKTLRLLRERRISKQRLATAAEGVEEQQSPKRTPRRSARNHASEGVPSGTSSSSKAVRSTRSTSKHQHMTAENIEGQDVNANDDGMAPNEPVAELPEEEEVMLAANSLTSTQTPQKRGRGRPPKSKKANIPRSPFRAEAPASRPRSARQSTIRRETAKKEQAPRHDPPSPINEGENVTRKLMPIIPRVSQIPFAGSGTNDALDDTVVDEETEIQQNRKKKRKAPSGVSRHSSTVSKRTKRSPAQGTDARQLSENSERNYDERQVEADRNSEAVEEIDEIRLFGQGWRLEEIYQNLSEVGQSHRNGQVYPADIDRNDEDVRLIHRLCKQAINRLNQLEDRTETSQSIADSPEEMGGIELAVQRLCEATEKKEGKASEIYFHTIPVLVKLLKHMIASYERIDGKNDALKPMETISIDHLRTAMYLIAIILKLGDGALEYDRPDPTLAVVRPVKHGILKPLKEVYVNFMGYLQQNEQDQARSRRQAIINAQRIREEHQEQLEREQRERDNRARAEWLHLHDERRYVEPFGPAEKLRHLRMPDPPIECDQNDEQYVRVELFKRRIGPHPVYVKKALDQVWSEQEIAALEDGLREFAGPRVFQDIFRAHCGRKGALSRYNVTEIVTTAADLREHLAAEQMEEYGEVEDWVKEIPVWVKIPTMSGQENASMI